MCIEDIEIGRAYKTESEVLAGAASSSIGLKSDAHRVSIVVFVSATSQPVIQLSKLTGETIIFTARSTDSPLIFSLETVGEFVKGAFIVTAGAAVQCTVLSHSLPFGRESLTLGTSTL